MPINSFGIQMRQKNSGNDIPMYPVSRDRNIQLTSDNGSLPDNIDTLRELIDSLGELAFSDSIVIPDGTTQVAGVVQLSNVINDTTEESTAATTKAVSNVNASAVHTSGEESINGLKTFNAPIVVNGEVKISSSYNSQTDTKTVTFEILSSEEEEEDVSNPN